MPNLNQKKIILINNRPTHTQTDRQTDTHTQTHTHTQGHHSLTSELDLGFVVPADDGVGARRLTPVETRIQFLHLRYLQLHLVVPETHYRDVTRCHAFAERRVGVAGIKGGNHHNPLPVGIPGHHPLEILRNSVIMMTGKILIRRKT